MMSKMSDMERIDLTIWKMRQLEGSAARRRRSKIKKQQDKQNKHRKNKYEQE